MALCSFNYSTSIALKIGLELRPVLLPGIREGNFGTVIRIACNHHVCQSSPKLARLNVVTIRGSGCAFKNLLDVDVNLTEDRRRDRIAVTLIGQNRHPVPDTEGLQNRL